jgi:hypothetical protein
MLTNCVLMQFNVEKIISDNGPGFRNSKVLEHMQALGITIVNTVSLHPMGRGSIERVVQSVKLMMRKMFATKPTSNWKNLPYILCKSFQHNSKPQNEILSDNTVSSRSISLDSTFKSYEVWRNVTIGQIWS